MEKKIPLGTYNFIFTSIYMKESEVFIIRNHVNLLSKSTNHSIPNRVNMNKKNLHPRASLYLRCHLLHSSHSKGWKAWAGRWEGFARVMLVSYKAGPRTRQSDFLVMALTSSSHVDFPGHSSGRPCPQSPFVFPSLDKPSAKKTLRFALG